MIEERKTALEREIIDLIEQNNYEVGIELLKEMRDTSINTLYALLDMLSPIHCKNKAVYGFLYIENDIFVIKFKDNEAINISLNYYQLPTKQNYNLDYDDEEEIVIADHSFLISYNCKRNDISEINIIDKDSRKMFVNINQNGTAIYSDMFKFFDVPSYEFIVAHKWLLAKEPFPEELLQTITKCKVLLSLSS